MRTYPEEFKNQIIVRMLPPRNCSIPELVKETGIPKETLYTWRSKHRLNGSEAKSDGLKELTGAEKFQLVIESAVLNEKETGEFCRNRGIFPEQLTAWRMACEAANEYRPRREEQAELREIVRKNNKLESELRRKDKALAETAVLLVLQKKVQEIWGEEGDAKLSSRSGKL